jgi:hypothetical protein
MSSRRQFVKQSFIAGIATSTLPLAACSTQSKEEKEEKIQSELKHWVWINPDKNDQEADLKVTYQKFYDASIRGVFFEADSELHYRTAKASKLEAHRWMWTMNRGEKSLLQAHPEWYAKNRLGDSCADKPPYVDYYRWLCPSRPEVLKYLQDDVNSILSKDYIDGIHLDYVRFCDVVLPLNLWSKYKIEQTKELPEYDYCYCEVCQDEFQKWRGSNPLALKFPEANLSWRLFRYNAITNIVNELAKVANEHHKPITAAVFPTPEVARRNVRQDWTNWNLDAVCPMIYHGFYQEPVEWIGDAVTEGIHILKGRFPLYAGLFLPDFNGQEELKNGITYALKNGASGVSIFGKVNEDVLNTLKAASDDFKRQ